MDPVSAGALIVLVLVVTVGVLLVRRRRYVRAEQWMAAASEHPEAIEGVSHVATAAEVKDSTDPRLWEATIQPGTRNMW